MRSYGEHKTYSLLRRNVDFLSRHGFEMFLGFGGIGCFWAYSPPLFGPRLYLKGIAVNSEISSATDDNADRNQPVEACCLGRKSR